MPQVLIVISINGPEERFQIVVLTSCTSVTIIFLPSGPFLLSAVCNCYNGNDNYPQCIIITQTRHTFDTLIIYWIIMAQMRPYPFLYSFTQWWGLRMSYFCVRTCVNFPYLCLLFQTAPYNNFIYVLINSALLVENIHYIIKQSYYYGVLNHPCDGNGHVPSNLCIDTGWWTQIHRNRQEQIKLSLYQVWFHSRTQVQRQGCSDTDRCSLVLNKWFWL